MRGGPDYAVRLIHPNLGSTEGGLLNTNTPDINGNFPYQTELEGINTHGEIIHSYFFKNKNDDCIEEKISYAKLYKPFDWIIATGNPLDDVHSTNSHLVDTADEFENRILLIAVLVVLFIFCFDILFLIFSERLHQKVIADYVRTETTVDPLTGAYNRKNSHDVLNNVMTQVRSCGASYLVIMLDI
ncbi:MAG: cache domain-containing protein, partial [Desulfovibrionaceae bacterium]|nr:cache domain-containing protein [Desulfovibrionaceae bacterium]